MHRIHSRLPEVSDRFGTEELAADFMVGALLPFDEQHIAAGSSQTQRDHGTGEPSSDDQVLPH
jgi:hypothetical protein